MEPTPQSWHENMEIFCQASETSQTRLPRAIQKCQVKHRTQLLQEFLATQGIRTLNRPEIMRRGWTRRMIKSELAGEHTWISDTNSLYQRETVEAMESRPEINQAIERNLEARALGGIDHQGSLGSSSSDPQEPVRQPIPKGNKKKEPRRERQLRGIERAMSSQPEGGGPLYSGR